MKRLPLLALQKAIYERLSNHQSVPVYDAWPDTVDILHDMPCISFSNFTYKPDGAKREHIARCTLQIDIWSNQEGRKEVQEITNDVMLLLEYTPFVLDDNFSVISQEIEFFESFPEEATGYHGVITFAASIYDKEEEG